MDRRSEVRAALNRIARGKTAWEQESPTLDFKEEGRSRDDTLEEIAQTACCFANSEGGSVVLGVADRGAGQAAFVGTSVEVERLRKRVFELSRPPLLVEIEELEFEGVRLLLVLVPQSPELHSDPQGRAPRRIGTDCIPMTPNEQMRAREDRLGIDGSAKVLGLGASAASKLALEAARRRMRTFSDERRQLARLSDRELLSELGLLGPRGRLRRAGQLLFCEEVESPSPLFLYQYRATPGGEPRAIERLEGPLLLAFERVLELVRARQNATPVTLRDGQQILIEDFPELAVREALANASLHRDLHLKGPVVIDHSPGVLTITSPGPLVQGVTPQNILTHHSKPRNPALARAARLLGLAEEVGRGVDRMYREMIRAGRDLPRISDALDQVRVTFAGGAPNTQVARYMAQLPADERDDTDTLLILFQLCSARTVNAQAVAPVLQRSIEEAELSLRRLAGDSVGAIEPTRETARRAHPAYRLRAPALQALGTALPYHRRTTDEIDRKVIAHVREYGKITNKTVQNFLDVGVQRARAILADLVEREVLEKTSAHQRGPGVEYGPGSAFPAGGRKPRARATGAKRKLDQAELRLDGAVRTGNRNRKE